MRRVPPIHSVFETLRSSAKWVLLLPSSARPLLLWGANYNGPRKKAGQKEKAVKLVGLTIGGALVLPVLVSMVLAFGVAAVSEKVVSATGFGLPEDGPWFHA